MYVGESFPTRDPPSHNKSWNLKNINWNKFSSLCEEQLNININDKKNAFLFYDVFMSLLTDILNKSVAFKNNYSKHRQSVPWWTKECSLRIKKKK